jgi:protoporphyrinogen oxidase
MVQNDIVIVGGGLSGLSLAFYCAKAGLKVVVLEKEDRAGGCFHSHRIRGDDNNEYWLELGAHTCYNSYQNLLDIIDSCQLGDRITEREKVPYVMLVDNQVRSILSQINIPELLTSLPHLFFQNKTDCDVSSYYSKIVGKRNYQKVFRHFFNAVPSQNADEFPADILFKKRARRKDVLKSFTFDKGLQTIVDTLTTRDGMQVLSGKKAKSIELINGNYCINTNDDGRYETKTLALATPACVSADLLQLIYPEISQYLATILPAKINSTGVILQKKHVRHKSVAGIVSPDDLFYSVVSRDTVPDNHYRGFTFHFKPDVRDEAVRMKRIEEVLEVNSSQIEHCVSKLNLLPAPRVGHNQLVEKINALLENKRLLLTGNYFAGISIEDCVSRSLNEYQRLQSLNTGNYAIQ